MKGQMALPLCDPRGSGSSRLPFAISARKVRRAARLRLQALGVARPEVRAAAEDQALLEQIGKNLRQRARGAGRKNKLHTALYLSTPEGRRAVKAMDRLSEHLARQEARLCV